MIVNNNHAWINQRKINESECLMSELEDYYYIRIKALEREVERLQAKVDSDTKARKETSTNNLNKDE